MSLISKHVLRRQTAVVLSAVPHGLVEWNKWFLQIIHLSCCLTTRFLLTRPSPQNGICQLTERPRGNAVRRTQDKWNRTGRGGRYLRVHRDRRRELNLMS